MEEGQEEEEKESGGRERGMGMIMGRFWRRVSLNVVTGGSIEGNFRNNSRWGKYNVDRK